MGTAYGYVRVSTQEQNVDRQLLAMRRKGIGDERIYIDRASGKDFNRPRYQALARRLKRDDAFCKRNGIMGAHGSPRVTSRNFLTH